MDLRETRRRNADGTEVSYLALAHNVRDDKTGVPKAQIVHNFGRADVVDREALKRLVRSISRFVDPVDAFSATLSPKLKVSTLARWARYEWPTSCGDTSASTGHRPGGFAPACGRHRRRAGHLAMMANRLSVRARSKLARTHPGPALSTRPTTRRPARTSSPTWRPASPDRTHCPRPRAMSSTARCRRSPASCACPSA